MRIGDDNGLDFLHFSSCQSMNQDQWAAWPSAYGGAHQIDGFHGDAILLDWQETDYRNFAWDAFYMSIADAWIDNMYRPEIGTDIDQCPVAHAVGEDEDDALSRIESERYNNVMNDPDDPAYWVAVYVAPCDPRNGDVLEETPLGF